MNETFESSDYLQRKLERLEIERQLFLDDLEDRIEQAQQFHNQELIDKLEDERLRRDTAYANFLVHCRERLNEAKSRETAQEEARARRLKEQAKKRESHEKSLARLRWLEEGGEPAAFEKNWPQIWQKRLQRATAGADEPTKTL